MIKGTPITHEERKRVADWIKSQGKTPHDFSRYVVADHFGISARRARTIIEELRLTWDKWSSTDGPSEPGESHDVKGDEWTITLPKTRIHTLDQLLEYCEVDLKVWEVERFVVNKWEVGAKNKADQIVVEPLYQVKAWLKKKSPSVAVTARLIEEFQRKAESYSPQHPAIIFRDLKQSGNMAEISIYDHHFGALIWGKETGWEDYDTTIAVKTFRSAVESLLSRSMGFKIDRIMLSLGNDLQNADNRIGTTEAGTPQSNDSRYEKVCVAVQESAVWAIDACREVAPEVIVPMIRGNHDPLTTFHLGGFLQAWFRNCPNVKIDNSPLQRKAFQHGTVMLMLTHGKGVKTDQYPLLMASEYPQMWAATTWREAHHGHIHTRRKMIPELDEIMGVAVRSLPSLRPPCSWGSDNGYVDNMRSAESLIWNEETGLIGSAVYSVLNKRVA